MSIAFDQYQRYKNVQIVVDQLREDGQYYRILEVGANEHKNLEKFLPQDEIYYLDIQLSENLLSDPRYFLGDATAMNFDDNEFDVIVALDVYEHISPEKRESFLSEVNRVSKNFFIICAPFYSPEVVNAEIRANLLYKSIYGVDYIWLKEHQENSLPDFDDTKEFLFKQNIDFFCFSHGDSNIWEQLMNAHFLSVKDASLVCYCDAIDDYYNQYIFEEDYVNDAYRKFIVGVKTQKKKKISFPEKILLSDKKYKKLHFLLENFNMLFGNKNNDQLYAAVNQMKVYETHNQLQIFYDYGEGFSEENSFKVAYGDFTFSLSLAIPDAVQQIRIDPVEEKLCMIGDLLVQNEYGIIEPLLNGGEILGNCYIFDSRDPQILINRRGNCFKTLFIQGKIWFLEMLEIQTLVGYLQQSNITKKEYEERLQVQEARYKNDLNEIKVENENLIQNFENQKIQYEKMVRALENKEIRYEEMVRELENKDIQYKETTQEIKNLKQELNHYQIHYQAAINQREELKTQLQQVQLSYDVISNANCWKMTAPLRYILDGTKRILKSNKYTYLFCKGLKCLKQNGFAYTWVKVKGWKNNRLNFQNVLQPLYTESELETQKKYQFSKNIKFSILVPLYNTPEQFLREMIQSVLDQTYANWELCLADGSDDKHSDVEKICRNYAKKDKRIKYQKLGKNLGISGNTNACIEMATGEYIGLFDHDDLLHPAALYENMKAICEQDADFIYTDENTFHNKPEDAYCPHFKPDYAPDTLRSYNYICHFTVFERKLLEKVGGCRSTFDGSQDYDLILRLTEQANHIVHIPKILYYWRSHANSVASDISAKPYTIIAAKKALKEHLERCSLQGIVKDSKIPSTYQIEYAISGKALISIIIPNKDHIEDLVKCIQSIIEKSTYPYWEIVIIENNSVEEKTFEFYRKIVEDPRICVVHWDGKFNYSAINNFGVRYANGEYVLLLNNDVEVITPDWLEQMLMFAQRGDIGAVGAMLYYPDDTVQHAGVILGIGGVGGHAHKYFAKNDYGYMSRLTIAQNYSAVTAACMMIPRSVWDEVNGLDESFEVAFNDVDLCMRIRKAGYLIVWTPYAELYHYESKSRGLEDTPEKKKRFEGEVKRFQERWAKELQAGDPYYNPNFTLEREDFSLK